METMPPRKTVQRLHENSKPCWKKATIEQRVNYTNTLKNKLKNIKSSSGINVCSDLHCKDAGHMQDCDSYLVDILESIKSAAELCIPSPGKKKNSGNNKSPIMNWKEEIEPFKDTAMFWHSVWMSAGRPINTVLHQLMKKTRNVYHYQIRKSRKMSECIKKNTLLDACINDNGDIFKEIRKLRKTPPMMSSMIDGVTSNIKSRFAKVYERLYNSVDDKENLMAVLQHLNININSSNLNDVEMITPKLIEQAISKLKNDKTDPIFQFNSNCLKNAPSNLCVHLAKLFKMFLIHGHVSMIIMVSTVIPLIKDKLGDINSSNNYRSIAMGSLILKIFDWVILLLFDKNLSTDELQFGYQQKTSTNMCSWLAVETIDYFVRNGSEVFVGVMDMTKAFDNVKQSILFWKLIEKGFPPIYLRLLLNIYTKQKANVCWNGEISDTFSIGNGVKQGGVLSPRLYCIYIDDLFGLLRRKKTGCWVNGRFVGIVGYADDLLLIAPSRDALQEMIKNCEEYAKSLNLSFSTHEDPKKSKTKCIAFVNQERELKNILLNGKDLPWVKTAKHLGCKITDDTCGLNRDLMEKRAIYINKVNELTQEFYYAYPLTKVRINNIFNSHFYGSSLWYLFGKEAIRLEKSWNVSQRIMLGLPRNAHRYFIEPLTNTKHIKYSLFRRYIKFVEGIESSEKSVLKKVLMAVKYDCRSNTGKNLRKMMKLTGRSSVDDLKVNDINKLIYSEIPEGEVWKIILAEEIMDVKSDNLSVDNFTIDEINEILMDIVA